MTACERARMERLTEDCGWTYDMRKKIKQKTEEKLLWKDDDGWKRFGVERWEHCKCEKEIKKERKKERKP